MRLYWCPDCEDVIESDERIHICKSCNERLQMYCENCHQAADGLSEVTKFSLIKRRYYTEWWCKKCAHPASTNSHTPLIRYLGRWWPFSLVVD